jgi:hypothetical protein
MKIVLSRKGFDSSAGGVASPILPDGTLLSLPIPDPNSDISYNDLNGSGYSLGQIVEDLTRSAVTAQDKAHLDPDLEFGTYRRRPGWRPLFGQDGAAQGHLMRSGVRKGDLFLFFGWFRQTQFENSHLRFRQGATDQHVLFGWLQIGTIVAGDKIRSELPSWARYHPHHARPPDNNNTIYMAAERLWLDGRPVDLPGAGPFKRYCPELCLTAPGSSRRTEWQLPRWFYPRENRPPLSYHSRRDRWSLNDDHTLLRSVGRGQEFVLDTRYYPESIGWVQGLFAEI